MNNSTTYVGFDVHAKTIQVAMLLPGAERPVLWEVENTVRGIGRLAKRLVQEAPGELVACYEAGLCGYHLQRELAKREVDCRVVAPSLVWRAPGKRVKNDRRDATQLALQLRAGMLAEVLPPSEEEEGLRDLLRDRDACREQVKRAKLRVTAFCRKYGMEWRQSKWTKAHWRWLRGLRCANQLAQQALTRRLAEVEQQQAQLALLDAQVLELARSEPHREVVDALCCLRGIRELTAMALVAELYAILRFPHPRQLMSYLGLTSSEHSSGEQEHRGRITGTGNRFLRRLLVEAAQHQRHEVRVTREREKRRASQPGWVVEVAERAEQRLHQRYVDLRQRNKPYPKVMIAVAREMVGSIWELMTGCQPGELALAA